jgi:hypothetical protein
MIKLAAAAVWICVVTLGAVFWSFQSAGARPDQAPPPPMLGGLDYVRTEMVSVPVLKDGRIDGYFLTRLVYTIEPAMLAKLSVPLDALLIDETYSYVFGNPGLDFVGHKSIDLDAYRKGLRERINGRIGAELIHEVMVEQVDFMSKDEIRDNAIRRRQSAGATAREMAKGFKNEGHH